MKFSMKEFQNLLNIHPKNKLVEYIESVNEIAPEKISLLLKELGTADFSYRQILYYLLKSTDNKIFHLMILNSTLKIFTRKETGDLRNILREKIEIIILSTDIEEVGDYLLLPVVEYYKKIFTVSRSLIYRKDGDEDSRILTYFDCADDELSLKLDLLSKILIFLGQKKQSVLFDYFLRNISFFKTHHILLSAIHIALNSLSVIQIEKYLKSDIVVDRCLLNLFYMKFKGEVIQSIALKKLYSTDFLEALLAAKILLKETYRAENCYCTARYNKNIAMSAIYRQLQIHQDESISNIYDLPLCNITLPFTLGDSKSTVSKKYKLLRHNIRICSICYDKVDNKSEYEKYTTGETIYYLNIINLQTVRLFNSYFNMCLLDIFLENDIIFDKEIKETDIRTTLSYIHKYRKSIINNRRWVEDYLDQLDYVRLKEDNLLTEVLEIKDFIGQDSHLLQTIEKNREDLSNREYQLYKSNEDSMSEPTSISTLIYKQDSLSFTYDDGLYGIYSGEKESANLKIFNREILLKKNKKTLIKELHLNNIGTAVPYHLDGKRESIILKLHQLSSTSKLEENMIGQRKFNELFLSYNYELLISVDYFNQLRTYFIDDCSFLTQIAGHMICGKKIRNTEKILLKSNNKFLIGAIRNDMKKYFN